ncbi:MAG: Clp protease ClpP [Oscillospiraceae bacterium]|nr:Clp protease ClpP [Oscillospiraceae bacterium]
MKKFWNWIRDDTGGRILRLEGPIDDESFWGDEVTPKAFREELESEGGDITVWINSPGGNVFAAAEIYTMLKDYAGAVTVKIASLAASAASVVAVAGDHVQMSPTAILMVHDPSTIAMGNTKDMERAITTLNEVKECIINAYMAKTGLRHNKIAELMSNETWMNAKKALELGFADEILYEDTKKPVEPDKEPEEGDDPEPKEGESNGEEEKKPFKLSQVGQLYSTRLMGQTILNRIMDSLPEGEAPATAGEKEQASEDPAEEGVIATEDPPGEETDAPVIGMDGKTKDGSVPFAILEKQLEFLR